MGRQLSRQSRRAALTALAAIAAGADCRAASAAVNDRPVLEWYDAQGTARPVRSLSGWRVRRRQILQAMQAVMGELPDRAALPPAEYKVLETVRDGAVRRLRIDYSGLPGESTPAYLLLPAAQAPAPALLALHQTTAIGKGEPAGLNDNLNLRYGIELARRGYVVLAPDYPTFGDHRWRLGGRWASGSAKAIWDNMRGLDLLQSLPQVDPLRLGAIGHSLGGHNALFTAAFDDRIAAVVSSCGFTRFHRYYGGNLTGWSSDRYMPRIREQGLTPASMPFDFFEVLAAIAPRSCLAVSPLRDTNFEVQGVRETIEAAAPAFAFLGAPGALQVRYPDTGHDFPATEREAAYRFLDAALRRPELSG